MGIAVTALATAALVLTPTAAWGSGFGDQSEAVLYDATGPVGTVLVDLAGEDDASTTIALPFPVNFFGDVAGALCITTNGVVRPVPLVTDTCASDYDVDLATYATTQNESVIGALLADLDPSEILWKSTVAILDIEISGEIATLTTAVPHGLAVGDSLGVLFDRSHPEFGRRLDRVVDAVPSPTTVQFDLTGSGIPDIPADGYTGIGGIDYSDVTDDSDSDGYADDGWGAVKQVYAGSTTVDGRPAFAVTWYRVPTNDNDNSRSLSNTQQVVLIQEPTANGGVVGFDFTLQFNFATLTDAEDGYDANDPTDECDSDTPENCRWSVGLARWDAGTGTAEEFEFFADYPITDLVDGGATPLVVNSLNSNVPGRYILRMIGGEVVGFSVPTLGAEPPALARTGSNPLPVLLAALTLALLGSSILVVRRVRTKAG